VTSLLVVFEAAIYVKSTYLIKSCLKIRKKRKCGTFYIKLCLKDCFGMEFTAFLGELTPEEALITFTVSDAYR